MHDPRWGEEGTERPRVVTPICYERKLKTDLNIVTRENIEQPSVERYPYKAEC